VGASVCTNSENASAPWFREAFKGEMPQRPAWVTRFNLKYF